jgi:DedD protein
MEARVRERLVGALVLVAVVVLFVPAILKGRGAAPEAPPGQPTRRVEVPVGDATPEPEELVLVPEPVADDPVPATPAGRSARAPATAPAEPAPTPSLADARESRTATTPAAKPPAEEPPAAKPSVGAGTTQAWAVQLGAFSNRDKAQQLVAQLRERRYAAFMLEYRAGGKVLYRVRVGPEQDRARAAEIAARLAKDGFQPVVARHP